MKTKSLVNTQRSNLILANAHAMAKKLDCPVSFAVYFVAIKLEKSGVGGTVLRNNGFDFLDFEYLESIKNLLRLHHDQTELLLDKAELVAQNLQDKVIGTEHLLLAILNNIENSEESSLSVNFMIASAGTSVAELKTELLILLGDVDLQTSFLYALAEIHGYRYSDRVKFLDWLAEHKPYAMRDARGWMWAKTGDIEQAEIESYALIAEFDKRPKGKNET